MELDISVEEWLALFDDQNIDSRYMTALLQFYYMPGHRGTCKAVAMKYGVQANSLNSLITWVGRKMQSMLNRFQVVSLNGGNVYWSIPNKSGRHTDDGFEWTLRDELCEALRIWLYRYLANRYAKLRQEVSFEDEAYKWQLITDCQGLDVIEVADRVRSENIIDTARDNGMIKLLLDKHKRHYRNVLTQLMDEGTPLNDRLRRFKADIAVMVGDDYSSKANDERTAAALLTCVRPSKYAFYKNSFYQKLCRYLGETSKSAGEKYEHYLRLIQPLSQLLHDDKILQKICRDELDEYVGSDLLLAQDALWMLMECEPSWLGFMKQFINNDPYVFEEMKTSSYENEIALLKANRNLILTGAPGTGKTYMAKAIAEAMGADVGFVQFHPSYDYTDFVEGLRPCQGEAGQVGFERRDGVFKKFCKSAVLANVTTEEVAKDLNSSPTVWKVSLGGTGDNSVRSDCMENGYIRIGWVEYGDVPDFNEFEEFSRGGKTILRAFQSAMQVGDIVLSCYSEKEVDAIGVVTGNYEYRKEGGHYPRYRSVKWLVKGIKENIVEQNYGKVMTQSSVYKLGISLESVMKILQTYAPTKESTTSKQRFVFIIDEINRGNISKIFGELFFSIDPGYRGEKGRVSTQYQNMVEEGDVFKEGFYVPDNVYIIGTMNDIDRSVDSMDFAMRRRFAWREVTAEESMQMLDGHADADELKARMQSLNRKIELMPELGWQYQIGAAYFLKYEQYMDFEQLWDYHLKGLLFEYLRGERRADEKLEELHNAYCLKTDTTDVDN